MSTHGVNQADQGCTCSDWAANMPHLSNLLELGIAHGQDDDAGIRLAPFRFCPWCGRALTTITGQRDERLMETYRQRIENAFFAGDEWGMPQVPNMLVTARHITDYSQATGDRLGTLDLMLNFVEMGTRFTQEFGDIDEPFYEGLELMLADFREMLEANPDLYEEAELAQRLAKLAQDAGWLGWGYGDYVTEQVAEIQQHFGDV